MQGLTKDINKVSKKIVQENEENIRLSKETEGINNKILALKQRHHIQMTSFEKELSDLKVKLDQTDSQSKRSRRSTMSEDNNLTKKDQKGEEFNNPAVLLKQREEKWAANNKEKKQLMDKYIKNIWVIDDAFNQIKEKTGIESNEEIVTTFIKAEE